MQILMFIRTFQMQILWKIVAINAVWCFVRCSVHFKVCGSQLAVCRQRWLTTISNTLTHDVCSSVNITVQRCKFKRVCDSCRSPLSGDRTVKVGHEIVSLCVTLYKLWRSRVCQQTDAADCLLPTLLIPVQWDYNMKFSTLLLEGPTRLGAVNQADISL